MRTKKRRKSLDERLLEARASAGSGRSEARRPSAPPPLEEAHEPAVAPAPPLEFALVADEIPEAVIPEAEVLEAVVIDSRVIDEIAVPVEIPAPPMDLPALEIATPVIETPEIDTPAPGFDAAARFDTAEQGVDEVARAVAALSASEGDTFLPSGAAMPAVPIAPPVRPAVPQPEPDAGFTASAADGSGLFAAAFSETTSPALPATREAAPEREAPSAAVAEASELPTGLMDRWNLTTRRARKATSFPVPTLEPEPPAIVAEPEEQSVAVTTLHRVVEVDEIIPVATAEPETPTEDAADEFEGRAQQHPRGGQFGRVGSTMIERGLVSQEQLSRALDMQRSSGRRVGEILVELGALTSVDLARVLADHFGVPFTDLRTQPPDPVLSRFLPEEVARRYDALAIARSDDHLVIAMANPTDLFALDDLQLVTRQPLIATMAVKEDLQAAIDRVYRGSIVETTLDAAASDYKSADAEIAAIQADEVNEGPIVGLVSALMSQAITDHASDLHIEPCSTHVAVRFRIDGVLHDSSEVPLELLRPLVSRLKILAGLDIAQNRVAQDGRFSLTIQGRSVDVRVVTMPTAAGESVILRLLDPVRDALGVSSLGLNPTELARFVPAFQGSQGAVFIVGPTGSGKTSTVYAVLSEINTRSKSIISVEDPVEFRLDGVKQMQINPRVGLTFATTLPSVLRADPDIVFIGEVRDSETARIAADASITGHLVLSTIHATRAAATPMRLIEMGVEPYLVASALTLVASQRLARKLCEHCAEAHDASGLAHLRELGADDALLDDAKIRRAVGCPACRNTGYRGRLPIFEIMPITERISRLILDRAPRLEIERLAVDEGMDTLDRAALRRVAHGDLSIEEMLRVIS